MRFTPGVASVGRGFSIRTSRGAIVDRPIAGVDTGVSQRLLAWATDRVALHHK